MSRIASSPIGSTLAATRRPDLNHRRGNVILARAVALTATIGRDLLGLSADLDGRDTIPAENIAEVRATLARALAALNEVATEANAADSGLLLDGATWADRDALSAKRSKGNA